MEDSDYREVVRKDLAKRRQAEARAGNRSGEALVSFLLLIAFAVVVAHSFGFVQLPTK